jgi:hypothetical protein
MVLIGMVGLAVLVAGAALVLLVSGLGRAAGRADDQALRDAEELLQRREEPVLAGADKPSSRAERHASVDRMLLPGDVAVALAEARPRFVREAPDVDPADAPPPVRRS